MVDMFDLDAFFIGTVIGTTSSISGALIDYFRSRYAKEKKSSLPGCIYLVSGGLGVLGFIVIIVSFILQSVGRALSAGLGVLVGFTLSFILLMILWIFIQSRNN
ncbi:MAG: hypothetical protein DWQ04_08925 [Chloroflexi bacterium]|nr:MAG: hypothetical protein DWQ04_08925 [Chloroflexota bacterium]